MSDEALEELLQTARTFYAHGALEGEAFREAPETKRFQEAWAAALANHAQWQALVSRLRHELPGMSVSETTAPFAMAARRCCVYMAPLKLGSGEERYSIIVGLSSVLAPYFYIYRIAVDVRGGKHLRSAPLPRPREGAEGAVADVIAKHLEQELGSRELPSQYETVLVPEICVRNLEPGKATLLDALFDDARANIP